MKILVTGGAGFIGSNFIRFVLSGRDDIEVINIDALTYAGNLENLRDVEPDPRYTFHKGDVGCEDDVNRLLASSHVDAIVHFAAESHVDRSLHHGADVFIRTNVLGTQVLLDAARKHGVSRYVQISTDEVYGSLGQTGSFSESTPLAPRNPYAATKAGADCLVQAAHHSHGLDTVITRCSNNYGPYQFPEKLIPLMIGNALGDQPLPVYGDGLHVRDWIHVDDHCAAIECVLRRGRAGEVYNIGAMNEMPNIEVVRRILAILKKPDSLIRHVEDRPGHDRRYAMDARRIREELDWAPAYSFESGLEKTIAWYLGNREWLDRVRSGEYASYYETMYGSPAEGNEKSEF